MHRTIVDEFVADVTAHCAKLEAIGEVEVIANIIFIILEVRFGKLPKSTCNAVRAITDMKEINKLLKLAGKCKTLDKFNKALK